MQPHLLVVDNYDSFTQNVVHGLIDAGARCEVVANDACAAAELAARDVDGFVISAGPCTPTRAGASLELVQILMRDASPIPLLGLCLGMQAIALANGASLRRAEEAMHGELTDITHEGAGVLGFVDSPIAVARYNSLVVDEPTLPAHLHVTARDPRGEVMALRHDTLPHEGVQFHPESWLCPDAMAILHGWVEIAWLARQARVGQGPIPAIGLR